MESIRILQDTYEKLYALSTPLADLMESEFKKLSQYWKNDYVDSVLQQKGLFKEWNHLYEIDMYYLLEILRQNWRELSQKSGNKFFSKEHFDLFVNKKNPYSLFSIRNDVSHPEYYDYKIRTYNEWQKTIENCAASLQTSISELLYELHQPEKERILKIILDNVIEPNLLCPDLPDDIRKSVLDTKKRLEDQNTASGIIAFFTDALKANRGKKSVRGISETSLKRL